MNSRSVSVLAIVAVFTTAGAATATGAGVDAPARHLPAVTANDNRTPAGTLSANTLTLNLRASRGVWQPEGPSGPSLAIEAMGEDADGTLTVPAPLIRVPQGITIKATLRNDLDAALRVHGLCERTGAACRPIDIPAHGSHTMEFAAGRPGTYHYWATSIGAPVPFREMVGAFIVDEAAAVVDDRVFVITEWTSLTAEQLGGVMSAIDSGKAFAALNPGVTFTINGRSWPATERLTYRRGDAARWQIINLSSQAHPMHLHGFYFTVESLGNGVAEQAIAPADRHPVVTQLLSSGATMRMVWTPEREGNWLFHCHIMHHVSTEGRIGKDATATSHDHSAHAAHDASAGMAGMILGVTVTADTPAAAAPDVHAPARRLTLRMSPGGTADDPSFGFSVEGDGPGAPAAIASPGPPLVLRRGEPVAITVKNDLNERTSIHWHGIELDSYYDGVHNFSGIDRRLAPMIEPGGQFVVRFTPPRTGTFMYHTHLHDERQLPLGLYGPLIVVEPGSTFDPAVDHAVILGRRGLDPAAPNVFVPQTPLVVNGERAPVLVWKSGTRHRLRLINITPDDILSVTLQTAKGPLRWTPIAKDGATLPEHLQAAAAAQQTIAVGETYDFAVDLPPGRQTIWLEVRTAAGKWEAQAQVVAN